MTTQTLNQVQEIIKNLPLYSNLNEAFENSKGDIIFLLDGGFFVCSDNDEICEILIDSNFFEYQNGAFIKK